MTTTETIPDVLADMGLIIEQEHGSELGARSLKEHLISFRDRIESALASAEPVAYEERMRPVWDERAPWTPWERCSRESYENFASKPNPWISNDWEIQRRSLYTHAKPAAKVEALATGADYDFQSIAQTVVAYIDEKYRRSIPIGWVEEALTVSLPMTAPMPASDYPECSGDPASCPENEGHGCCKPNPVKTPASVPDYSYIIERIAASWDECMHVDSLDSVIDIGADIRDQWKRFVSDATNPAPASLEGFGPMPSPDLSGLTIRPTTPEPTP